MPRIIFEQPDGSERAVDMAGGQSVMQGAVRASVRGIDADCGGALSCATCMVYVAPDWVDRLPAKSPDEDGMLQFSPHAADTSRLSCQIMVDDSLNGLRLKVPASQH
jgi:2Fe-2S ferredoxin